MSSDKSWPSRFGTLGEKVFGKDDPFNDADYSRTNRNVINDEMPPTRSPITGKIYTSKAALRAEYKAYGATEVGTAYENGYSPEREQERRETDLARNLKDQIVNRYRNGR
jgi:hypothetical protein